MRGQSKNSAQVAPRLTERKIDSLVNNFNFQSMIEYEIETSLCNCEDKASMCRCKTIEDYRITDIWDPIGAAYDITRNQEFKKLFLKNKKDDEKRAIMYALERSLGKEDFDEKEGEFELVTGRGYYGEEVQQVSWHGSAQFTNTLKTLKNSSDQIIKKSLENEYGHLLPHLKKASFVSKKVAVNDLVFPQQNHHNNLNQEKMGQYEERFLHQHSYGKDLVVWGVCQEQNGKFLVIDGYHRLSAVAFQAPPGSKIRVWVVK